MSGTFMQSIAQAWLVLTLTGSGYALGLVMALQFLPILILGPIGGVIADRFDKRKVQYFTQSAAGLQALLLATLVATGSVRLWMVYVLAVIFGLINVVDNPVRQTFIFEMVGEKELRNAVTLNGTLYNISRIIGPAIAGVAIASIGLSLCFFLNAFSYIAVLIVLGMMRKEELHPVAVASRGKGLLRQGIQYVLSTPKLRDSLLMMAVIGTFTYEFQVSLPLIAQYTFHGGASGFAAFTTAMGIGSILGGFLIANQKSGTSRMLVASAFLFGLAVLGASAMPTFTLMLVMLVVVGVFSIYFTTLSNSILQLESKPAMRGRVMSLWSIAFLGSTTIGGPAVGWVGEFIGPRWGLAVGGFAALAASLIGAIRLRRRKYALHNAIQVCEAELQAEADVRIP